MKTLCGAALLFCMTSTLLVSPPAVARDDSHEIKTIRDHYEVINRNLRNYSRFEEKWDQGEGGTQTAYYRGGAIRKTMYQAYGCVGQYYVEHYFWNNRLFFSFEVQIRYAGLSSWKIVSRRENRFYFSDGKLIRWLDENKRPVAPGTSWFREEQEQRLKSAREDLEWSRRYRVQSRCDC